MNTTFHLYRLQQIDSQVDKAQKRLDEIQKILDDNTELKHAKAYLDKCQVAHHETENELQKAEGDVQDRHIKIEQSEAMLYGGSVKNPKEVQDLQNKTESLKRYLTKLQDIQLEAMLAHEENTEILQSAQSALDKLKGEIIQQNSQLAGEQSVLNKNKERLLTEREVALPAVQPDQRQLYEGLRKTKRGIAIASIKEGSCSACGAALTKSQQQTTRSNATIAYCPSCKRILYDS
ncbi:MAG: hypothetical protein HQ525_10395 [Anaerolineae bacterium]|nr:hypothetical protein [Anaerolineae bacterium]